MSAWMDCTGRHGWTLFAERLSPLAHNTDLSCHFRVYLTDNRVPDIFFDIRQLVT